MNWLLQLTFAFALETAETSNLNAQEKIKQTTPTAQEDLQKFVGTWELVTVQPPKAAKNAKRLVFRKDGTYAALDNEGKELWAGTFELDSKANPKIWDHRSNESKKNGGDALGIYELNGDALNVCVVAGRWKDKKWIGKPRPREMKLDQADVVIQMRRVKD